MAGSLHKAKKVKNDEFYTRYKDIAEEINMETGNIETIYGDDEYTAGDFRSEDSINYLKEADIVITNPPFSLFKEYISQLINNNKSFIVVGNKNAVTYKEVFPLIKNNQIWIGARSMNSDFWLYVPDDANYEKLDEDGRRVKHIMACWYTNLDLQKRHDGLWHIGDKFDQTKAHKYYKGFEEKYPKYDNYNGINIDNVKDIPIDYEGMMGVPITFIDKFNPREFEILGCSYSYGDPGEPYHKQGESFNVSFNDKNVYKRIFIRNLNPISRAEDRGY